jgi:hypothetical protein
VAGIGRLLRSGAGQSQAHGIVRLLTIPEVRVDPKRDDRISMPQHVRDDHRREARVDETTRCRVAQLVELHAVEPCRLRSRLPAPPRDVPATLDGVKIRDASGGLERLRRAVGAQPPQDEPT